MRQYIIAGNWKMNKTRDEAIQFSLGVSGKLPTYAECVVCAPFIILRDLVKRAPANLGVGAQNMDYHESGAFTGEVSPVMLKDTEVTYVIIGHSERRAYYNETDETVNLKVKKALEFDLKPIVCVGEVLEERESGKTEEVLARQVALGFKDVKVENPENLIVAYEPVWAIGTGKNASSAIAEDACKFIRGELAKIFGKEVADEIRILYGGSVKPENIKEYMANPDVDGALVGGASLKVDSFVQLCNFKD